MTLSANTNDKSRLSPIIVPLTGLVHGKDRGERALTRKLKGRPCSILLSSTYINRRITELAHEIILEMRKKNNEAINLLIVLKGAVFFGCRLAQEIFIAGGPDITIHFVSAYSYGKAERSSGRCRITGSLNMFRGKDVIVVEDICDTGLTLSKIRQRLLKKEHAASVKTCVLLDKPANRLASLKKTVVDFIGFQIPNIFVAGFGLDYTEKHRELSFIVAVRNRLME